MGITTKLKSLATRAKNSVVLAYNDPNKRRLMLRCAVMLMAFTICMSASAAGTVATTLGTNAKPWIYLGLRIFGGCLAIGGITVSITGFTGRDEGVEKVIKIGTGLLLIALGVYILASPNTVLTTMGINPDEIFSATA